MKSVVILFMTLICSSLLAGEIMVSSAISFKDALLEIKQSFKSAYPDTTVNINFGSSGKLKTQIESGAPVDLYISASKKHINSLNRKGLIAPNTKTAILKNRMVLVSTNKLKTEDLTSSHVKYLAIGNPDSVPSGTYAKEVLLSLNIWDKVRPKLIFGEHARQVTSYIAREEVEAAIIFKTDYMKFKDKIGYKLDIPKSLHSDVTYYAAGINRSRKMENTLAFLNFIRGDIAKEIIEKHGFEQW